jgi:hypothetical protein
VVRLCTGAEDFKCRLASQRFVKSGTGAAGSATNDGPPVADAGAPGTTSDGAALERISHMFLDKARSFNWDEVVSCVGAYPNIINQTPCGRWSALHQAAFAASCATTALLISLRCMIRYHALLVCLPGTGATSWEIITLAGWLVWLCALCFVSLSLVLVACASACVPPYVFFPKCLHVAEAGRLDVVQWLVHKRADITITNAQGQIPEARA